MKIFVSWSGERSKALANALREWLPMVLHYADPWLSERDLGAGDRWAQEIAKELEAANFGIICVTPENIDSPWILFEAGALAKSMNGAKVIPLLFGLEYSDLSGPLAQFQAKKVEKDELGEVIHSIYNSSDGDVSAERASHMFEALWPLLQEQVWAVEAQELTEKHMRPQHEILEELVTGVRGLDSRFGDLSEMVMMEEGSRVSRRYRRFHPMMFEEISEQVSSRTGDPVVLLIWAGFLRQDMPWISEVLTETYRELRANPDPKFRMDSVKRLDHVLRSMSG